MRLRATQNLIVQHPEGYMTLVKLDAPYEDDDPVVNAFPWLFAADGIEAATRAPGEKRITRR